MSSKSETAKSDTAKSDTAKSNPPKSGTGKSNGAKSHAVKADAAQAVATPPSPAPAEAKPRKRSTARSKHAGMGAIVYSSGVGFRVWAPSATRVFVAGTFNGWAADATPLANERNGYWSADVTGAKVGDGYKFRILNGEQELWRIDPYARQVTNSVGEAVVLDPAFDWGDDDERDNFRAPA